MKKRVSRGCNRRFQRSSASTTSCSEGQGLGIEVLDDLDRRLLLAIAAGASLPFVTPSTCGSYSGTCGAFACGGSFKIKP